MTARTGNALIAQMNATSAPHGALALWWLGQMGMAVKGQRTVLYFDPYLTGLMPENAKPGDIFVRAFPPPLLPREVSNADAVLCSHEHGDHTDPGTLAGVVAASPQAQFVISGWATPQADQARIPAARRIIAGAAPIDIGEFRITPLPAAHVTREADARGERWLGFLVEGNGVTLYHSGDTVYFDGYFEQMRALPTADLAVVASNGRDAHRDSYGILGNFNPAEAVWAAKTLGWDTLIFGHNDLFPFNSQPPGAPAEVIASLHPRQKWHMLQPGEMFLYVK